MDIIVELAEEKDLSLEIGRFADLQTLVDILDAAWESFAYRLEKVPNAKNLYVFVEDPVQEDSYDCGVVEKIGNKAFALSPAVHDMIMGAYSRYVDEFGSLEEEG